jgi:hypothetical protein
LDSKKKLAAGAMQKTNGGVVYDHLCDDIEMEEQCVRPMDQQGAGECSDGAIRPTRASAYPENVRERLLGFVIVVIGAFFVWINWPHTNQRVYSENELHRCSVKIFAACNDAFVDEKTRIYLGRYPSLDLCQAACFEQKSCKTFTYHEPVPPPSSWPSILVPRIPVSVRRQAELCYGRLDDYWSPEHAPVGTICGRLPRLQSKHDSEERYFASHRRPCKQPKLFYEDYEGLKCWHNTNQLLRAPTFVPNVLECEHQCTSNPACGCATFDKGTKRCFELKECEPAFCDKAPEYKNYTMTMLLDRHKSHLQDLKNILFPELDIDRISKQKSG